MRGTRTRRKKAARRNRPFDPAIWKRALTIARNYRLLLDYESEIGWVGSAVEMPNVFADAKTPDACVRETHEALTAAVATLLELGRHPPEATERKLQLNIRVTPEEKLAITSRASRRGFRGVSDFVRAAALNWT